MLTHLYKKAGIPMRDMFGVPYPEYHSNPMVEYNALVNYAGIIDLTHWSIFRVTGKDRAPWLNAMVTNDVSSLGKGQGCHAMLTTTKGKIIADLLIVSLDDNFIVFVPQGDASQSFDVLNKHIVMEDVTLENVTADFGVLSIEGPTARDCLWRVFPTGPFPKETYQAVERKFEAMDVLVVKHSVTGEDGYHLLIPAAEIERFRNYLIQAARGSDGLPIGSIAWNMRRTENGCAWYGTDFSQDNFPPEARLDDTISYTKGCFHGQETLARLKYQGHVNRQLVGLTMETNDVPASIRKFAAGFVGEPMDLVSSAKRAKPLAAALDLTPVFPAKSPLFGDHEKSDKEKSIGWITTTVFSPQQQKPLFLGYVRHELAQPGATVMLEAGGKNFSLRITDLPLSASENSDG